MEGTRVETTVATIGSPGPSFFDPSFQDGAEGVLAADGDVLFLDQSPREFRILHEAMLHARDNDFIGALLWLQHRLKSGSRSVLRLLLKPLMLEWTERLNHFMPQ